MSVPIIDDDLGLHCCHEYRETQVSSCVSESSFVDFWPRAARSCNLILAAD